MSQIQCTEPTGNYQNISKEESVSDLDPDHDIPRDTKGRPEVTFQNPILLTVVTFIAHFLTCGVSYSIGVYYVTFLDVFNESNGVTSWIASLNTGTLCASGMYRPNIICSVVTLLAIILFTNVSDHFHNKIGLQLNVIRSFTSY